MEELTPEVKAEAERMYKKIVAELNGDYCTVFFTIEGKPRGKERPKFNSKKKKCYTPDTTVEYEKLVKWSYRSQCKSYYFGDKTPLKMVLMIYYYIAKSDKKQVKKDKLNAHIRPTLTPDIDNVIKAVCDGLNGLAYKDDAQIVEVVAKKYYSDNPRVEVQIREVC